MTFDPSGAHLETQAVDSVDEPLRPSAEVRAELLRWLEQDESRVGQVHRLQARDLSAEEIAAELEVATPNFVWNAGRIARAIAEGDLPTAPSVATGAASKFRSMLRDRTLTAETRRYLEHNLSLLQRRAGDQVARTEEVERAREQTDVAESRNEVGVYVYVLPHYLRYPYDPDSGRTLMKVGRSDSDVIQRFRNQTRTTALPEEPILLRVYRVPPPMTTGSAESTFHRLLEAADHSRSVARTAGREWFVTSTRFLDELARVMGLDTFVVTDVAEYLED